MLAFKSQSEGISKTSCLAENCCFEFCPRFLKSLATGSDVVKDTRNWLAHQSSKHKTTFFQGTSYPTQSRTRPCQRTMANLPESITTSLEKEYTY